MLFTFSSVVMLLIVVWAWRLARYALDCANEAVRIAEKNVAEAASEPRLLAIEAEMLELSESIAGLRDSLKKVRGRLTMRQNRNENGKAAEPDWRTDPTGYKKFMRQKLGLR